MDKKNPCLVIITWRMKRLVVGYEILKNTSVEGLDWLQTEANIKVLLYFTF